MAFDTDSLLTTMNRINDSISFQDRQKRLNRVRRQRSYSLYNLFTRDGVLKRKTVDQDSGRMYLKVDFTAEGEAQVYGPHEAVPVSRQSEVVDGYTNMQMFIEPALYNISELQSAMGRAAASAMAAKAGIKAGRSSGGEKVSFAKPVVDYMTQIEDLQVGNMLRGINNRIGRTPDSASDDKGVFGILYWLPKANTGVTTSGFVGQTIVFQDGSTTTTCGGIDASTNDQWRSRCQLYTSIDNQSYIESVMEAIIELNIDAPEELGDAVEKSELNPEQAVLLVPKAHKIRFATLGLQGASMSSKTKNGIYVTGQGPSMQTYVCGLRVVETPVLEGDADGLQWILNLPHWDFFVRDGWWWSMSDFRYVDDHPLDLIQYQFATMGMWARNRKFCGAALHKAR